MPFGTTLDPELPRKHIHILEQIMGFASNKKKNIFKLDYNQKFSRYNSQQSFYYPQG